MTERSDTPLLELVYEGRGVSGKLDLMPWICDAEQEDVQALMTMWTGSRYEDAPYGIRSALSRMAGIDGDVHTVIFRDQTTLLAILKERHPLLWEAASGFTLRCNDTFDMFSGR